MAVQQNGTNGTNGVHAYPAPLKKSGSLDKKFRSEETTPIIGREYIDVNIVDDLLNAEDGDDLLRDLAITSMLKHLPPNPFATLSHMIIKTN